MSRRPRTAIAAAMVGLALLLPTAAGAKSAVTVDLDLDRTSIDVGQDVVATVTVTNLSDAPSADLAVHIDVTDPAMEGSVDPEDWTETLTLHVGVIEGGGTVTKTWTLTPISGGRFSVYVVALTTSGDADGALSQVAVLDVAERRSINPQGVLPVVVGVPALLGAALVVTTRRRGAR